ncbi:MAG: DivIVA domain-containing protein [Clostridia bacterium]|nr:DivIVA domain-containing protein [Clostridia bacterium]
MAISVRDIQEKEFATQAKGGYNVEEVDDFLDEIAEQLAALVRENLELGKQVTALEADVETARQAAIEAEKKTPDYNEKGYFDNLQKSMREAMIGAQRIADQTLSDAEAEADRIKTEAQQTADDTLSKAQAEADKITGGAQGRLEALTQQYDALKAAAQAFKADFGSLLEAGNAVLKDKTDLI